MREKRKYQFVCASFFLLLCAVWLVGLLQKDRSYSAWEKRMLAQKPEVNLAEIWNGTYESDYEDWVADQFPGRDGWIRIKTCAERLLGKKEINGIYLGKDGYQFRESEEKLDWDELELSMAAVYGEDRVSRIAVPNAGSILEEKLPEGISFPGKEDAVSRKLKEHRDEYIYYRTDHHWTMLGAYYAYSAWMEERGQEPVSLDGMEKRTVKDDFLGTHYGKIHYAEKTDVIECYDPGTECSVIRDLGESSREGLYEEAYLDTEDAYRYFLGGDYGVVQIDTDQEGGHLVLLKDSFANCFVPFLTRHYSRITVIDPRYFRTDICEWLSGQDVTEVLILSQEAAGPVLR